jgi:formylglycine-generating enzyme required for sulfatase activity
MPIFQTIDVKGIPIEMCLVPPGSFMMGKDSGHDNEKPIHPQILKQPYWIGVHPVTNDQWQTAVAKSNGVVKVPEWAEWYNDRRKAYDPVIGVTWYQCAAFVRWLSGEWDLPTEMEWEYAARGLDNLTYPFGNDFKPDLVVYNENSNSSTKAVNGRPKGVSWVGAHDMCGNILEWTSSIYQRYPYKVNNGSENMNSDLNRVLRGGSWIDQAENVSANHRGHYDPTGWLIIAGFRIVLRISGYIMNNK